MSKKDEPEVHTLHDNRDVYYRSRAKWHRDNSIEIEKRLATGDIIQWERERLKSRMEDNLEKAKAWDKRARDHVPQF